MLFAGFLSKKSAKTNGWSKRWFVLNEKTGKVCNFFSGKICCTFLLTYYFVNSVFILFNDYCKTSFYVSVYVLVKET
jgi:hypothetical protein